MVRTYGADFLSNKNSSKKNNIEDGSVTGTFEEFNFNGVCVWIRNLASSEGFEDRLSNDFSMFKLHFTIRGSSHFHPLNNEQCIEVPNGYCNLYHISKINFIQKFIGERIETVEVLFTKSYLKYLFGESYEQVFDNIGNFPSGDDAHSLWKNSKMTPPKLTSFLLGITESSYSGRARESFIKAKIDCILIEFFLGKHAYFTADSNAVLPVTEYAAILKVEAYVKQNLKKHLTIDHLSSVAGLNTTKLKHEFKKVFTTTIFKYITRLRMEKAKQLVVDKNFSIAQASYEVGYTNPQHFTVAFKKTMGYLPSKLQKNTR